MGRSPHERRADRDSRAAHLAVSAAVLVMFIVVALAGSGPATGARERKPSGAPALTDADARKLLDAARRRAERHRSPNERAARVHSRVRYRGLTRSASLALARREFREAMVEPNFALSEVLNGARVRRWLGQGMASIESPDGERSVVLATSPLRTGTGPGAPPIDLHLKPVGKTFVPRAAAVPVEIGRDVRDGFSFPDEQLGVHLDTTATGSAADGVLSTDRAFWAGAAGTDADFFAKPVPAGAETYFQLRSAASPERYSFTFDLPTGAKLRIKQAGPLTRDTGVDVVRNGRPIATLPPASAHDADGTSVDVIYSVNGNRLILDVPHRGRDLKYPLLVDPIWSINYGRASGTNFDFWEPHYFPQNNGNAWVLKYSTPNPLLELKLNGAMQHYAGANVGWKFVTSGDAKVFKIYFHDFYRRGDTSAIMRLGIYSTDWEALWNWNAYNFENWRIDVCADRRPESNCSHAGGTPSNSAAFLLETPTTCIRCYGYPTDANYSQAGLRSVELFIADQVQPGAALRPQPSANWVDDSGWAQQRVDASDYGVGVERIRLRAYAGDVSANPDAAPPNFDKSIFPSCTSRDSSVCPKDYADNPPLPDPLFNYKPPEGVTTIRGTATDATGNTFHRVGVHRSDRSAPNVTLLPGDLDRDRWVKDGRYSQPARANDAYSGVKSLKLKVGEQVADQAVRSCDSTLANPCPSALTRDATQGGPLVWDTMHQPDGSPFQEGRYQVGLEALDALGHPAASPTATIGLDRTAPVVREPTSGDLRPGSSVGAGVHTLAVSANDTGAGGTPNSGVKKISYSIDGGLPVDAQVDCGSGECSHTFDVDTRAGTGLAEGRHSVRLAAYDGVDQPSEPVGFDIVVDRTAPTPPGDVHVEAPAEGLADAVWQQADDPSAPLSTAEPSGVTGYRTRSRTAGQEWSRWYEHDAQSRRSHDDFDHPDGAEVQFEVVAVDAAGNTSEPVQRSGSVWGIAPTAVASDELEDLEGDYVGTRPERLHANGEDEQTGIRHLSIERESGEQVAAAPVTCTNQPAAANGAPTPDACPVSADVDMTLAPASLPEGPNELSVVATDRAGNRMTGESVSVMVDRTAPAAPSAIALSGREADGHVELTWTDADDPPLGDAVPGSGTAATEYRIRRDGGTWSEWIGTEDALVSIADTTEGEQIDVELRTYDSVGNQSALASASFTVQPNPADEPPPAIDNAPAVAGAEQPDAAGLGPTVCTPRQDRTAKTYNLRRDYRRFVEIRTRARAELNVYCVVRDDTVYKIEISAALAYDTGRKNDDGAEVYQRVGKYGEDGSDFYTTEIPWKNFRDVVVRGTDTLCTVEMGGTQRYIVVGSIKYYRRVGSDETRDFATDPDSSKRLTCPDSADKWRRQAAGWKWLSRRAADNSDSSVLDPSRQLIKELGAQPYRPPRDLRDGNPPIGNAWGAHHVVPVGQRNARGLQALMFRCKRHPNAAPNGIYLRQVGLKRTFNGRNNEYYDYLADSDDPDRRALAKRTYHPDTFYRPTRLNEDYVTILAERMKDTLQKYSESCPIVATDVDGHLAEARRDLRNGEFGVESGQ